MNKQLAVVLALLVVALLGGGFWMITRNSEDTADVDSARSSTQDSDQTTDEQADNGTASGTQLAAFTAANVAEHNKKSDCWTIISGKVYDITTYVPRHPGGDEILMACGADGTSLFTKRETSEGKEVGSGTPHSSNASAQLESLLMGDLATDEASTTSSGADSAAQ